MSYYYKYNFVSPIPTYALVKEELKSYFDAGLVDDLLFPIYTNKVLDKLGKSSYKIGQALLHVDNFQARLPEDFIAVREAWMCTPISRSVQLPNATYTQIVQTSTRIDNPTDIFCDLCSDCQHPAIVQAIYKTTNEVLYQVQRSFLLKPGNISTLKNCGVECANIGVDAPDNFDIRDNKFAVSFREGVVHLVYYIQELTEEGYQLIPDNVRIKEYLESFLKYKIFEQLCNAVTDETYKQIDAKKQEYKQEQFEKQVIAEIELKKQTAHQKHQASLRTMTRNSKYEIR